MSSVNKSFNQADGLRSLMKRHECKENVKTHQSMIRLAIVTGQYHEVDPLMDLLEQAQLELESTYFQ
ncbi:hypothetical protein C9I89_07135 [Photobacterium lipolyticum]|uniref:Uncharacterized protein n=1 Tax=Photobacterium lipolyticum TaxID=266810 RepID=A0A2T3N255_9GAMM|nr:hypothetical protein C9I89_07135 [Photobacterium lipolyticum]